MMLDVSGDRWVTPQDALVVINELNHGGSGEVDRRIVATDDYFARILPINASAGFASGSVSLVVPQDPLAPVANGDFLRLGAVDGTVRLDVLANDTSPTGSPLRIVSVSKLAPVVALTVETSFGAIIKVDPETNTLLFRPGLFGTYEQFVYVVSDAEGRLSQGKVAVTFNE